MQIEMASQQLAQLGHPVRLQIYRLLIRSGSKGLVVGEIAKNLNIPNSTLTHHLNKMIQVELIFQIKNKQHRYCQANIKNFKKLMHFLQDECCIDSHEEC